MKIAVVTTEFLQEFVKDTLKQLRLPCEVELFNYHDFSHIGELYLELEDYYDGFMVSGPVPRQAIIKRAHALKKPIMDFGTDAQSYYETFLQLIYRYGASLSRGYFDLLDWFPGSRELPYYLARGTFQQFYTKLNDGISEMSLSEIAALEKSVQEKHIKLWKSGAIDFSTTRFSSIVPALKEAGVNYHFIYPHIDFVKSAFDALIQEVNMRNMRVNQTTVICVTIGSKKDEDIPKEILSKQKKELEKLLISFNKETLGDFKLQSTAHGYDIFTSFKTVKQITESFTTCSLKAYMNKKADFEVCLGYGIGNTLNHAIVNAEHANTEANINSTNASFLINENDEMIGPLGQECTLVVSGKVTPYILRTSRKVKLSTLTIQKILSVLAMNGTDQVTPQSLAAALNITVRSANRFLKNLLEYGEAEVFYEKQNSSRGRPERVYKIFLQDNEEANKNEEIYR